MKKDNTATIEGIKWAAGYLKEHPEAPFAELMKAKPEGLKVWKGIMGSVRTYMETGKVTLPKRKKANAQLPKTPPETKPVFSIFERLDALERLTRDLNEENRACADRISDLAGQLGLEA